MGPREAIMTCLRKSFDFSGCASRSEFWWFFGPWLFLTVLWIPALSLIYQFLPLDLSVMLAFKFLKLFTLPILFLLPLAALVRRHRDIGIPPFLPASAVIPAVGIISSQAAFVTLWLNVFVGPSVWAVMHISQIVFTYSAVILVSAAIAILPSSSGPSRFGARPYPTPQR